MSEEPRSPAPLELHVYAGDAVSIHPLPPLGSILIGRSEDAGVRITDLSVSRRHAILHLGATPRIEDLGSANGTFVNPPRDSPRVGDTRTLQPLFRQSFEVALADVINLGSTRIMIRRAPPRPGSRRPPPPEVEPIVADPAMRALYEQIERVAQAMISVLLLGETGVGKEVVAQAIHRRSTRRTGPFQAINCAALPSSLLESELFGNEKGAFTGADRARPGLFEAAEGGTVFLDEVGELPPATQVKLLRVLEDRKVLRVGGRAPRDVDVRFIAATNRDLEAAIASGAFREDLFFRLNGIALTIPPLRERVAEVAPLARMFAERACAEVGWPFVPEISAEAMALLERYSWPGNVRELRNVVDRAIVLSSDGPVLPDHLPSKLIAPQPAPSVPRDVGSRTTNDEKAMDQLRADMGALERRRIVDALERSSGNQTQAAELLGISRRTLVTKLGAYDLPRPRKKRGSAADRG